MKRQKTISFLLIIFILFGAFFGARKTFAGTNLEQAILDYNKGEGTYQERLTAYEQITGMLKSEIQKDIGTLNQGITDLTASGELAADDPVIKGLNESLAKDLNALYTSYNGESLDVIDELSSQKKIDFYNEFVDLYSHFLENSLKSKHDQLVSYTDAVNQLNSADYPFQADKSKQYLNQWDTPLFETKDIPELPSAIKPITLAPPTQENKMTIKVLKKWRDNQNQNRPKEITIDLMLPGSETPVATLLLSQQNGWKGSFKDLPVHDNYQVKERKVSGYETSYSHLEKIEGNIYQVEILNTLLPSSPNKPNEPQKPKKPDDKALPRTGESQTKIGVIISGLIVIGITIFIKKRRSMSGRQP